VKLVLLVVLASVVQSRLRPQGGVHQCLGISRGGGKNVQEPTSDYVFQHYVESAGPETIVIVDFSAKWCASERSRRGPSPSPSPSHSHSPSHTLKEAGRVPAPALATVTVIAPVKEAGGPDPTTFTVIAPVIALASTAIETSVRRVAHVASLTLTSLTLTLTSLTLTSRRSRSRRSRSRRSRSRRQ
jgi:hypothetical protein